MPGRSTRNAILAGLIVMIPNAGVADSMRCGKWVVNEQATVAELVKKCGEPLDKTSTTEDVLATNAAGHSYKVGTTTTERWFYQRSTRSLRMVVTIVDGEIKSLERAE